MRRRRLSLVFLSALVLGLPTHVTATCDAIPGATQGFRSAVGVADRPFARPGDTLTIRLDRCHPGLPPLSPPASQYVVALVFTAAGSIANAIVIRESCLGFAAEQRACERTLADGLASCIPAADVNLAVVTDDDGPALRLRFPDTDAMVAVAGDVTTASDRIGFAGPVTIAVTRAGEPLPCGLATARCRDTLGLTACIDELFLDAGDCGTIPHPLFGNFTALPPANDFGALCSTADTGCTGTTDDVRIALDRAGNLLVPMDWRRILVRRADLPVARLLRSSLAVDAFAGGRAPLRLPDDSVLGSFSVKGVPLPPIFTPQQDPTATDTLALFGSADAPEGILRIARRTTCAGGPADGLICQSDAQCAAGRCTGGLFDFSSRAVPRGGPLVLRRGACFGGARALLPCTTRDDCPGGQCLTLTAEAADAVPLDGLHRADGGYAFVVSEALLDEDRNGDHDQTDDVVQLVDAATGTVLVLSDGTHGRAVVRLREPPFSRPALVTSGDVVAFLEPEALAGDRDANDDGDRSDTLLRAFRLGPTTAVDLTLGEPVVADAALLVGRESVAISGGKLYFRTSEAALARHTTTVASRQHDGLPVRDASTLDTPQSLSADGRWLVFVNYDDRIVPGDVSCTVTTECRDAFLVDRDADGNGIPDEVDGVAVTRVSASDPPRATTAAAISADATVVAFISYAPLVPDDTNAAPDVYIRMRQGQLERVSIGADGTEAALGAMAEPRALAVSHDGSVIAFASEAPLAADDTNGVADVYVRDRRTGTTTRASVGTGGIEGNDLSFAPTLSGLGISGDGRLVVFDSEASNLVPGDDNGVSDVFVHDRLTGATTRLSVGVDGEQANGLSRAAAIAADGSAVAFTSVATNLVPGVTSGVGDVFVHDLATGVTTVASIASNGTLADRASGEATFSADGRFLAFASRAATLVPDDRNGIQDVFIHDRTTGLTERVNLRWDGAEQPNLSLFSEGTQPSLTADGRSVVFVATDDLAEGIAGHRLVYTRAPDPTDDAADLTRDGDLNDTVLRVLDLAAPPGTPPATLCPATQVAVADGKAAFLRPEAAGKAAGCPPGTDLDGDGDSEDTIVHFLDRNGIVSNLGTAASAVALSADWIAALVGAPGGSIVQVHPATATGAWTNVGQAADLVEVRGNHVIFVTPEKVAGLDLNDDRDMDDRVLQVADAATGKARNIGYAVEDFVASDTLVAFRVREASQGATSLNGDRDTSDDVLFVYDLTSGILHATGQAVTPCRLEACDPRLPYRPLVDTVRFLTFEAAQRADLNGDDDQDDLVVQTFNVRAAGGVPSGFAPGRARHGGRVTALAAIAAGVCSDTGVACGDDDVCGPEARCIVPPGTCVLDVGSSCRPGADGVCGPGQFCGSDPAGTRETTCRQRFGECRADGDCPAPARCLGDGQRLQRLVAPLAPDRDVSTVLPAVGRCVDAMGEPASTCRTDADCAPAAVCRADVITAAVADRDGDEVPDAVDLCPDVPDPAQRDRDGDGVGDACDRRTLGNDTREPGEECDGADDAACPGRCGPEATCVCTNEARGRALLSYRKAGAHLRARLRLPLETYGGEPIEVRLDGENGHAVASAGVGTLRATEPGRTWSVRGDGAGLQSIRLARPRRGETYQLDLSARRWQLADGATPNRLTVIVGDSCFTVRVRAPRRHAPGASSTSTTAPPTTTSVSSTTTTTTTTSTTVPPGTCCPPQRIVLETIAGGTADENELRFGLLPPFALPAGTRIILDSGLPDATCRHTVTIPPGGFEMSPFCIESLGWTADLIPRGCAAGKALGRGVLWDGGAPAADADLRVDSDTRDGVCNPPRQECSRQSRQAAENVLGRRVVTVGDGTAEAPALNLMLELPAEQLAWDVREPAGSPPACPDPDGQKHLATDTGQTAFIGTLRLTTATATAQFTDMNADGCSQFGAGSPGPRTVRGAAAPGPCCVVGQEMILAGADAQFTGGNPGDTLSHLRMRARIVACEPLPTAAASCDALEGGGRVVTSMSPDRDWVSGLLPADGGKVVSVGTADVPSGLAARKHFALARHDSSGRLDSSFGPDNTGRVFTDFGYAVEAAAAAVDSQGRIVVVGEAQRPGLDVTVARYLPDGRLDQSFGTGGLVVTDIDGRNHRAAAVAVVADDRLLVAGYEDDLVLLRYLHDGTLDPVFGTGGIVRVHASDRLNGARAMAVLGDGRIVVGGLVQRTDDDFDWLLARFDSDGALDPSFGTGGIVTTSLSPQRDEIAAVAVVDGDAIVAAGSSMPVPGSQVRHLVLARYRTDGTLDPTFGDAGLTTLTTERNGDAPYAMLPVPGGKLVVAGYSRAAEARSPGGEPIEPPFRLLLARFDATTGHLDSDWGFGSGGVVITSFGGFDDHATALLGLPDGGLLVGGSFDPNSGFGYEGDFALARYLPDGRLDPAFGGHCGWEIEPLLRLLP